MKGLAITATALVLALPTATALAQSAKHGKKPPRAAAKTRESGQPVIDWNQTLLSIVNTPGAQPANIQPTRNFAILHAAIYDAVNSIDRSHEPYLIDVRAPRDASETAAADEPRIRHWWVSIQPSRAPSTPTTRPSSRRCPTAPRRTGHPAGWRGRA